MVEKTGVVKETMDLPGNMFNKIIAITSRHEQNSTRKYVPINLIFLTYYTEYYFIRNLNNYPMIEDAHVKSFLHGKWFEQHIIVVLILILS